MGDDDVRARNIRGDFPQASGDIFVGQAVKSVSPDALAIEVLRNCVTISELVVLAMECRVEAGDLRDAWTRRQQSLWRILSKLRS